jgi:hypothetical protein
LTLFACSLGGVLAGRGRIGAQRGPGIADVVFVFCAVIAALYHGVGRPQWIVAWTIAVIVGAAIVKFVATRAGAGHGASTEADARPGLRQFFRAVGDFQARLVLTIFYFTAAMPFGVKARWLAPGTRSEAGEPLQSFWVPRAGSPPTVDNARRQF